MSTMASPAAEAAVKKLARLPSNCVCPNCGTEKKFGFGTVCVKYWTFVCNECKSSHQAISHRCKSITMSSWSMADVETLQAHGNDVARRTWLQHAPAIGTQGRPQPGRDSIDVYKAFIVDVYERKKYYGNADAAADQPQQQSLPTAVTAPPRRVTAPPVAVTTAPSSKVVVGDLLDFGSLESHADITKTVASSAINHDPFVADFNAFSSSNTADTAATTSSTISNPTTTTVSLTSSSIQQQQPVFDPFSSSTTSTTINHFNNSDPFAPNPSAFASQPSSTEETNGMQMNVTKQPVMATPFSNNHNAISNAFASPSSSSSTLMMMMPPTNMNGWMPQQQQQQFMMMTMKNHNIQNQMMSGGMGMHHFASGPASIIPNTGMTTAMMGSPSHSMNNTSFSNMNGMQSMSSNYSNNFHNSISSNFGPTASTSIKKDDPFAGLGFK
jgi:hypothetical protein